MKFIIINKIVVYSVQEKKCVTAWSIKNERPLNNKVKHDFPILYIVPIAIAVPVFNGRYGGAYIRYLELIPIQTYTDKRASVPL